MLYRTGSSFLANFDPNDTLALSAEPLSKEFYDLLISPPR